MWHGLHSFDVSTHSRLKAAGITQFKSKPFAPVSTHSRLKAAGKIVDMAVSEICCFNTQPPEGGWGMVLVEFADFFLFQHTAA